MTGPTPDDLVEAYLRDLDDALRGADPEDREEILGAVRDHIRAAREETGRPETVEGTRALLDALGSVERVAAGAVDRDPGVRPARVRLGGGWVPVAVSVGALVAVVRIAVPVDALPFTWVAAWVLLVAAMALLGSSSLWTPVERLTGVVAGLAAGILALEASVSSFGDVVAIPVAILSALALGGSLAVLVLTVVRGARRARR